MDAKEYLSQAYRIDQRINSKLEQVMSLRALLGKATGTRSGAPKAAPPNLHSMEDTICKMVDMENQINDDIDTLVDLKPEIMACIKNVGNPEHQSLLELRYLCFKRWEDVAAELGYDLRYVYKLHDQALESCAFDIGQEKTLKDSLPSVR